MLTIQPLSVKFDPDTRTKLKKAAFLLQWSEGRLVNAAVQRVLSEIETPDAGCPSFIPLIRHALKLQEETRS